MAFSQQNETIYIFKFNKNTDEILYRTENGIQTISGFRILVNKKKIFFSSSPNRSDKKLNLNIDRVELDNIIKNDNPNKQLIFYVFLEEKNMYYNVAYMFRTIYD